MNENPPFIWPADSEESDVQVIDRESQQSTDIKQNIKIYNNMVPFQEIKRQPRKYHCNQQHEQTKIEPGAVSRFLCHAKTQKPIKAGKEGQ